VSHHVWHPTRVYQTGKEWTMAEGIRLNKYLSEAGVCSRREADRLIEAGQVQVDGVTATPGVRVMPGQKVLCQGKMVEKEQEWILLAFYKPKGIICTTADPNAPNNIVDYIGFEKRIYPVGRLDKDSEGLILMTNDGELTEKLLRGRYGHEKEYVVTVNRPVTQEFIEGMSRGVWLPELEKQTKPCRIEAIGKKTFRIILTQGLNRQIRRMCQVFGYRVVELKRVRIMNIRLGDLQEGKWRPVTEEERRILLASLSGKEGGSNGHK